MKHGSVTGAGRPFYNVVSRKLTVLVCALLSGVGLFAQQIPDTVMQAFKNNYPGVDNVTWRVENDRYFASYRDTGNIGHTIIYDKQGRMDMHQYQVGQKDVPNGITDYYRTYFPEQKNYDVWLEQDQNGKKKYYVPGSAETTYFDEKGNFLNKQNNKGTGTTKTGTDKQGEINKGTYKKQQ